MSRDQIFSFSFQDASIRGAIVQTELSFQELTTQHGSQAQYPLFVKHLLGEMNALLILIASNLKLKGKLNLQLRGSGHLYSAFTEIQLNGSDEAQNEENKPSHIRGIARRHDEESLPASLDLRDWVGENATLTLSLIPDVGQPYQGIIPVNHARIHLCIEEYYRQSEQIPTFFWTQITNECCAAIMLQKLPETKEDSSIDLETAKILADTLKPDELIDNSPETIVYRLFHEYPVKQHLLQKIEYKCSCSKERMLNTLLSLGQHEIQDIAKSTPVIEMNCQFCGATHQWQAEEILQKLNKT